MGVGLLAFAWHRMEGNPTPLVLGVATIAVIAGGGARAAGVCGLLGGGARPPAWAADVDALVMLFLPFALAQQTLAGLAALGLYAAVSFGGVSAPAAGVLARARA